MEYLLALTVAGTLVISFFSSLSEAALYSVPYAYAKLLADSGTRVGRALLILKEDIDRPIAAILILNTVANTTGPTIAGAIVAELWGEQAIFIFACIMTLSVLVLCEITPKLIGVSYSREIAQLVALPVQLCVVMLKPFLWLTRGIVRVLEPRSDEPSVSHEEVLSMTAIGTEEGALDHFEGSVITNVIGLDKLIVRDVLTPRVVVFRVPEDLKLSEIERDIANWNYTRVPLYSTEDPDHLTGYVNQRDLFRQMLTSNREVCLKDLARPLPSVPELMRVDKLLLRMFEQKEHICAVIDEHGGLAGIITLEDVIEEIVGREIVDEYDTVSDLRTFASMLKTAKTRKKQPRKHNSAGDQSAK